MSLAERLNRHEATRVESGAFEMSLREITLETPAPAVDPKREQQNDERPQLATEIPDMASYDVVFLGYPNWWGAMPMPCFTFLEKYDFSGKTIIPFCTHEGSRLGRSVRDITRLCPKSTVLEGLAVRGSSVKSARDDVAEVVRHSMPETATTWPARSGFPPREHPGHTYAARWRFESPLEVTAVAIRPVLPLAYVRVERVRLRELIGRVLATPTEWPLTRRSAISAATDSSPGGA